MNNLIKVIFGGFIVCGTLGYLIKKESDKELDDLTVEKISIKSDKVSKGYKLLFLSDLHDKCFGEKNHILIDTIKNEHPDLILIGGDTMVAKDGKNDIETTENLMESLTQIAPVYYGNGNHEMRMYWERDKNQYRSLKSSFYSMVERCGVHYLNDTSSDFEELKITGLNLETDMYNLVIHQKMDDKYIKEHVGNHDKNRFNILLAHSPLFYKQYSKWGADLILSGHFHGGIVRLPNGRGICSSQLKPFEKYCAGNFINGKRITSRVIDSNEKNVMVVSRGLGTHSINIRVNNKPQIISINLL